MRISCNERFSNNDSSGKSDALSEVLGEPSVRSSGEHVNKSPPSAFTYGVFSRFSTLFPPSQVGFKEHTVLGATSREHARRLSGEQGVRTWSKLNSPVMKTCRKALKKTSCLHALAAACPDTGLPWCSFRNARASVSDHCYFRYLPELPE